MDTKDIKNIIKILQYKKQLELAGLLEGAKSEVIQSDQYGSYWNSTLSRFLISAPIEKYYKLKELTPEKVQVILDSVLEVYPPAEASPEIKSIDFRLLLEDDIPDPQKEKRDKQNEVDVFISYSTLNKLLAGEIKRRLTDFGLNVFLAHEDIQPSAEWVEVILDNLDSTDIFIPIITSEYRESAWTSQESGIALAKNKLIIPVAIDGINPFGFIGRFQALKVDSKAIYRDAEQLFTVIVQESKNYPFRHRLVNSLIAYFKASASWEEAGARAEQLTKIEKLDVNQVNEIFRAVAVDPQIRESWRATPSIKKVFTRFKADIEADTLEQLKVVKPILFAA